MIIKSKKYVVNKFFVQKRYTFRLGFGLNKKVYDDVVDKKIEKTLFDSYNQKLLDDLTNKIPKDSSLFEYINALKNHRINYKACLDEISFKELTELEKKNDLFKLLIMF